MSNAWLKCSIQKGMFSDELAIKPGGDLTCLVPSSKVHGRAGENGAVRVKVFQSGRNLCAVLPTEYPQIILIDENQLERSGNDSLQSKDS